MANIQVAYDVITPKYFFKPGIVHFPLTATSDLEINLISMFISLTPGTILLDVSDDKKTIFIHVMYLDSREKFISQMKYSEGRILEIVR
jgi:multicomponent Na+:H+ antiporter subunit E